jgi:hypothetical protein
MPYAAVCCRVLTARDSDLNIAVREGAREIGACQPQDKRTLLCAC